MSRLDKIREGEGEGESSRLEIELFLRFHAAVVPPSLKTFLLLHVFQLLFFLYQRKTLYYSYILIQLRSLPSVLFSEDKSNKEKEKKIDNRFRVQNCGQGKLHVIVSSTTRLITGKVSISSAPIVVKKREKQKYGKFEISTAIVTLMNSISGLMLMMGPPRPE